MDCIVTIFEIRLFIKPERGSGKCLKTTISQWNGLLYKVNIPNNCKPLKTAIVLAKEDNNIIGFNETLNHHERIEIEVNNEAAKTLIPNNSNSVCMFWDNAYKVLFVEELNLANLNNIEKLFKKYIRYLDNSKI